MTDGLTAEERVQLNVLLRKQAEHEARLRHDINVLGKHFSYSGNTRDEIIGVLVDHADAFVAALKPFCKAKQP